MTLETRAARFELRLGLLAIAVGAALAFAIQVVSPVGIPLYDGVVVQEPYRFLHPVGDQVGAPASFSSTPAVDDGKSPLLVAATTENPPQAQLIAQADAFRLASPSTSLKVSVAAVDPPTVAPSGPIAGNVYRFAVTDASGAPLDIKPCDGCITLVLRAPEGVQNAHLERFADGAWIPVETNHAGMVGLFGTNPTALGDYAVVSSAAEGVDGDGGTSLIQGLLVAGGVIVVLGLGLAAVLAFRARSAPLAAPVRRASGRDPAAPRSRAIPSKRKRPPKPPSGRSS